MFPNRWVDEDDLPGFRSFMEHLYLECAKFHTELVRALSQAMGVTEDLMALQHQTNTSELRLNHYPSIPCSHMAHGMRIGQHSDFGTLTLLIQDSAGGLQVEDQNEPGVFRAVEPRSRYEVIVNAGDCLQRWTNDRLRSANHRVVSPEGTAINSRGSLPERYSVAYFGKPDRGSVVNTLPPLADGVAAKYTDGLTALQYNQKKLLRTYG